MLILRQSSVPPNFVAGYMHKSTLPLIAKEEACQSRRERNQFRNRAIHHLPRHQCGLLLPTGPRPSFQQRQRQRRQRYHHDWDFYHRLSHLLSYYRFFRQHVPRAAWVSLIRQLERVRGLPRPQVVGHRDPDVRKDGGDHNPQHRLQSPPVVQRVGDILQGQHDQRWARQVHLRLHDETRGTGHGHP